MSAWKVVIERGVHQRGKPRTDRRNAHGVRERPSVTLDLEEAAYSMIVRACDNSDLLGLPRTTKMREFENWFYEHVVGE